MKPSSVALRNPLHVGPLHGPHKVPRGFTKPPQGLCKVPFMYMEVSLQKPLNMCKAPGASWCILYIGALWSTSSIYRKKNEMCICVYKAPSLYEVPTEGVCEAPIDRGALQTPSRGFVKFLGAWQGSLCIGPPWPPLCIATSILFLLSFSGLCKITIVWVLPNTYTHMHISVVLATDI